MKAEKFTRSRTLKLNLLVGVAGAIVKFMSDPNVMLWISKHPKLLASSGRLLAVANVILRLLTNRKVSVK